MALSALADKSSEPERAALESVLGRSGANWDRLIAHLEAVTSIAAVKMAN